MNDNKDYLVEIKKNSKEFRKKILLMSYEAGHSSAHIGGAFSSVEILSTLFTKFFNYNKNNPADPSRDRFILSKGHGCLVYYSMLSSMGYITKEELKTFEKNGSNLLGHPVKNQELGIEFSNGSLGMGLSIGIGLSIGYKRKVKKNKVYVLMGDGECNEGSVWESIMCAPNFDLDNLITFIDNNNFQQTGSNDEILKNKNLKSKFENFGWEVFEVDGHNEEQLLTTINKLNLNNKKPKAIICKTIKGKGISFTENDNKWHHSVLTKSNYEDAIKELENNEIG